MEKKRFKKPGRDRRENIGVPTGIFDRTGQEIITGDIVHRIPGDYTGPVFWHREWKCYGIFMGCWYLGQDPRNPDCYGKCIELNADNGDRMSLEKTGDMV